MKAPIFMKIRTLAAITLSTGILFTACKKDKNNSDDISDDEVAEAVTQSVSASSGGMVVQTESTARMAGTGYTSLTCGQTKDTTIAGASVSGAAIVYSYSLNFNRTLTCSPLKFQSNFTGNCTYTAPRMSSNDNSTAQLTVTGLDAASTAWTVNSSYVRNGTQQSKVRLQRSFSSVITITSSNIVVDKATQKIVSGVAEVTFEGTGSGGAKISRGATLTFLGSSKGTLTLKNGSSYSIQW
jgi:hypothetical protein